MKPRTKKILMHAAVILGNILLLGGAGLLIWYCFNKASAMESRYSLYGVLVWVLLAVILLLLTGIVIHFMLLIANTKIHCPKCGVLGNYQTYQEIRRRKASKGIEETEKVLVTMQCPKCKQKYQFKKRFQVAAYSQKRGRWRYTHVTDMLNRYTKGKYWH